MSLKQGKLKLTNRKIKGVTNKINAFTLIELLAIIVILAIIAVITVPIILNIVENSKKVAAIDSAYGYKDSLQKYYLSKVIEDSTQQPPTEVYNITSLPSDFTVSGESPSEGWVSLEKGQVVDYSLKFGNYIVNYDENTNSPIAIKNAEVDKAPGDVSEIIEALEGTTKGDGAKYLDTEIVVYYNPTTSSACNSTDAISTTGTTGCLKWYLYSVKGNYVNMMLDHNINPSGQGVAFASKEDYETGQERVYNENMTTVLGYTEGTLASTLGISYPSSVTYFPIYSSNGTNAKGPLTALSYLKTNTSSWTTGTPKIPNEDGTDETVIAASYNDNKYIISYNGYHARLLTAQEGKNLGCDSSNRKCPLWMVDNTSSTTGLQGYLTSSPNTVSATYRILYVYNDRNLYDSGVANGTSLGIRPVITVLASEVLS